MSQCSKKEMFYPECMSWDSWSGADSQIMEGARASLYSLVSLQHDSFPGTTSSTRPTTTIMSTKEWPHHIHILAHRIRGSRSRYSSRWSPCTFLACCTTCPGRRLHGFRRTRIMGIPRRHEEKRGYSPGHRLSPSRVRLSRPNNRK